MFRLSLSRLLLQKVVGACGIIVGNISTALTIVTIFRPPQYVVNLDQPPSQRWTNVLKDKGDGIKKLIGDLKIYLEELKLGFLVKILDSPEWEWLVKQFPPDYGQEIESVANYIQLPIGEVVLYNVFYEFYTFCTSIIASTPSGDLIHARNLDFGLFLGWDIKNHTWKITEDLRPLIINVDFQRGGKTVFKSVHFAGYIGVVSGVKPGAFSLTINERFNVDGGYLGLIDWLFGNRNDQWIGFLTRDIFEKETEYNVVKEKLQNKTLIAPVYFILGGVKGNQASVITRGRKETVDVWNVSVEEGRWYVLETNYDRWAAPLFLDDRRTPAKKCMNELTRKGVSYQGLYRVLSTIPVLNKLTTYTVLMHVKTGEMQSYLRKCDDPCFPW